MIQLVDELEIVAKGFENTEETRLDEGGHAFGYHRHWTLREAINSVPARTLSGLKAKARAAEMELERDAADCEGPGSFVELSRSLINDLNAMGSAETRLQTAG